MTVMVIQMVMLQKIAAVYVLVVTLIMKLTVIKMIAVYVLVLTPMILAVDVLSQVLQAVIILVVQL